MALMKKSGNGRGEAMWRLLAGCVQACLCMAILLLPSISAAASRTSGEYEVKAAFLYNFIKFIEWPESREPKGSEPYVVGLIGGGVEADKMAVVLKDKAVGSRGIEVRKLGEKAGREMLCQCHVVFIFGKEAALPGRVVAAVGAGPVLTVGECRGFAAAGGVVGFAMAGENIRFEINNAAARKAGIKISSKLLKLAASVVTNGR